MRAKHTQFGARPKYRPQRSHRTHSGRSKSGHPTRERAMQAMREMLLKHGRRLDVYQCPECNGWHLGRNRRIAQLRELEFIELGRRVMRHMDEEYFEPRRRFAAAALTLQRVEAGGRT